MGNKMAGMRKATAVMLVATVGIFQSLIMGTAMAQVTPKMAGDLSVRGSVTLNGVNAGNGATVFDGGQIKTGSNGTAIINLGKMGQVELAGDSELVLKVDGGVIGGNLRSGRATVRLGSGNGSFGAATSFAASNDGSNEASDSSSTFQGIFFL